MMVKACVEIWPTVMGLLDDRENAQHIYNEIRKNLKSGRYILLIKNEKGEIKMSRLRCLNWRNKLPLE